MATVACATTPPVATVTQALGDRLALLVLILLLLVLEGVAGRFTSVWPPGSTAWLRLHHVKPSACTSNGDSKYTRTGDDG
jgi:hypothetical protein